jgi:hypothetical protein
MFTIRVICDVFFCNKLPIEFVIFLQIRLNRHAIPQCMVCFSNASQFCRFALT